MEGSSSGTLIPLEEDKVESSDYLPPPYVIQKKRCPSPSSGEPLTRKKSRGIGMESLGVGPSDVVTLSDDSPGEAFVDPPPSLPPQAIPIEESVTLRETLTQKPRSLSSRGIKPTTSYPIHHAVVRISVHTPKYKNPVMDIGFIAMSDGTTTTVLGRAFPLYNYDESGEKSVVTKDQKVTVTLHSPVMYYHDGSVFDAMVVYVDLVRDVAVFKFKCSTILPTVEFGSISTLSPGEPVLYRHLSSSGAFLARNRYVRDAHIGGDCGLCFHTDFDGTKARPGIYMNVDEDGKEKVLGFMMRKCPKDNTLHGLPVDILSTILKHTENLSTEVRVSSSTFSLPLDEEADVRVMLRHIIVEMGKMQKEIEELTCSRRRYIDAINRLEEKVSMLPDIASVFQGMEVSMDLMRTQIKTIMFVQQQHDASLSLPIDVNKEECEGSGRI